jgi:DNA-directed RNA polymerase II subunit RPB2
MSSSNVFEKITSHFKSNEPWWQVTKEYFDEHGLADHQIESYNLFMTEKLPDIIKSGEFEYTKDNKKYVVNFDNVFISKPEFQESNGRSKAKPQVCRIRNLNYICKVYADVSRYELTDDGKINDSQTYKSVYLGGMPCMVLSQFCHLTDKDDVSLIKNHECPLDPGGYFIINGTEKVLMSQDRMAHNEIFVFECKEKDIIKIPITGTDKNKSFPCAWSAEVRSYSTLQEPNITSTYIRFSGKQLDKGEDQRLYVELPNIKCPVPWPIVFMALGVVDKNEMISYVCDPNDVEILQLLEPSLEAPPITGQEEALEYLSNLVLSPQKDNKMIILKRILREKMFQNIQQTHIKRFYFGHMTYQLLATVCGRRNQDDRDHYGKKRVETAGNLINNLFKSIWKRVIRDVKIQLEKKRSTDLTQILYSKFSSLIKSPFATGNWVASKNIAKPAKVGISQPVNRHNYVSTLSCLRRVITPSDKNNKIIRPRHLHNSQWYYICPAETPEGQATGLIKNMSMLTRISLGSSDEDVITWLHLNPELITLISNFANTFSPTDIQGKIKVFINGSWVGLTEKPNELVDLLRSLRRSAKIYYEVSISYTMEGVRIYTDDGRVLAPFFVVNNGKIAKLPDKFVWTDLIEQGIIEYLDPSELETLYHSEYPWQLDNKHTHALVHPCFMLGVSASTIPFADHNQSPRNIYQSSMGKQALGVFSTNFLHRYDTNAHILCYPQKPIVNTMTMKMIGAEELPSGQNLIVAVMSAAYNQEDSVVINRCSLDNGALRSIAYTTYSESNHRKGNTSEQIKKPEKTQVKETRLKGYSKLDTDGMSKENMPLCKSDVVIGKVNSTPDMLKDISVVVKTNGMEDNSVIELEENGKMYAAYTGSAIVDHSILTTNEDLARTAKIRVRQMRVPQIGDKVASRSAQKGIIGMIVSPEDMPFSEKTGITPDLIMNPNAFPSRMTIGQALECLLGKACALNATYADCTPFEPDFKANIIFEELKKYGFNEHGNEKMINGTTGEEINCHIFIGPTYYQRLKHMVLDKIHSRNQDGPRETLTRQPVEGRKRGGGFRMGEMETWCGISHGASMFLIDRLVNNSDGYEMYVCNFCGNTAIATLKTKHFECKHCQQNSAISKIRIPYAFKLLQQELLATGIGVWYNVDTQKTLLPATTPSH